MKAPEDPKQLASFLGAICFYSRFVPKLSTLRGPLDRLMKKDEPWVWSSIEQTAFEKLKSSVAESTMLSHFQEDWPIVVAADASAYGIGGVLTHINPEGIEVPVAHFARSLTETEKRYSQIEKEALALVYTIKKCHKFIFGRRFKLQTDHRPLLAIFGSSKDLPVHSQNRLVRWAMTLMAYDFEVSYVSTGKFAKADWLSRVIQEHPRNEDDMVIAEVDADCDWRSESLTPVLESNISGESSKDSEILQVVDWVKNDSWKEKPTNELERTWSRVKNRLKIINGCLMLDDRVVVPKSLQGSVLNQLHEGHPGVVRMKQKARSFVYWKGLDSQIESLVRRCDNCQSHAKMPRVIPLNPWPVPTKPWSRIHIDFAGPLDGIWFLVVVDALTKYAEVKLTRKISAVATIDLLEEIFATHGYPEIIVSDNGTQLTSKLFKEMCRSHGILHKTTATYYPMSNGAAERFVDTLKRGIAKIRGTGSINQQVLNTFLINYRNTPHAALNGKTPAEVHFNRKMRTTMSLLMPSESSKKLIELTSYQQKMKVQYDSRNAARAKSFQVGQSVYVRIQNGNKWTWEYGIVRSRVGVVLYEVQVAEKIHRSHVNQLRKRYGDKSPEEVFSETVFPIFFEIRPALNDKGQKIQCSEGVSGGANKLNVPEPFSSDYPHRSTSMVSSFDGVPTSSGEPVTSDGRCMASRRGSQNSRRSRDYLELDDDERSRKSAKGMPTLITTPRRTTLSPDVDHRAHTSTRSHSLRRSSRIRRAPNRFSPSLEKPSNSNGIAPRGPHSLGHVPTRNRVVPSNSRRRIVPLQNATNASSTKGGDVVVSRDRPRWH